MPGIVGQATTYSLPNFVGNLFSATPFDTPFLSSIGGLTGGMPTTSTVFQWQGYDLREPGQNVALEGANAPQPQERTRYNVTNVVEIHHEAVEVSYTKQAAVGAYSGVNVAGTNPVMSEMTFQVMAQLRQMARDIEFSFIRGAGNGPPTTAAKGTGVPPDNTTPRKTLGLLNAITTNSFVPAAAGGGLVKVGATGAATTAPVLTKGMVDSLIQAAYDNGGISDGETATLMVGSTQKRALSNAYLTAGNYREASRNVGGVNYKTIETDFGTLNVLLTRFMPPDTIAVASLDQCAPRLLLVPDRGFLFLEPLAKVGASERAQLYGEVGLEYGNESGHAKLTGLATS